MFKCSQWISTCTYVKTNIKVFIRQIKLHLYKSHWLERAFSVEICLLYVVVIVVDVVNRRNTRPFQLILSQIFIWNRKSNRTTVYFNGREKQNSENTLTIVKNLLQKHWTNYQISWITENQVYSKKGPCHLSKRQIIAFINKLNLQDLLMETCSGSTLYQ